MAERAGSPASAADRRWPVLLLLLLLGGMYAAAAPAGVVPSPGSALDRWVGEELGPWLRSRVTEHPRLRGEPLTVAVVTGSSPEPAPDALGDGVRERLDTLLLETRGAVLAQEPAPPDWQQAAPPRLDCRPSTARYLVAVTAAATDGRGRVEVRIRDLTEQRWVSGFVRRWDGRLTREEQAAGSRRVAVETLRGRRGLPFEPGQPDVLAGRLALGLGCGLLARPGEIPAVWLERGGPVGEYAPALELTERYLARSRLLRSAPDEAAADMVLSARIHAVGAETGQLWVTLRPRAGGGESAELGAAAYVRLPSAADRAGRVARPAPASPIPQSPLPESPLPESRRPSGPVLEPLRVVRLPRPCRPDDCRARGERLDPAQPLPAGDPLALEAVSRVPARVYLLEWLPGTGLRRLAPRACEAGEGLALGPGRRLRHALDDAAGARTLFAVAVPAGAADRDRLSRLLGEVPAGCGGRPLADDRLSRWLSRLDDATRDGGASWTALRLAFGADVTGRLLAGDRPPPTRR